jgi:cupin 2 domain-containing protein
MEMKRSLFEAIPGDLPEEFVEILCETKRVKIERIVSRGHASPEGFWYDQAWNEWILLLRGSAGLKVEKQEGVVVLHPGDHLNIDAHVRHRVEWTDPACDTVWLAVYY